MPIDFRGSSQIVKYKENNLGIVHIRNEAFEYLSYLILFDKDMKILKISDPFSFFGANVEFIAHAEYDKELKILVSVHDQIIYEFHDEIEALSAGQETYGITAINICIQTILNFITRLPEEDLIA